jgi:hypothetical protein
LPLSLILICHTFRSSSQPLTPGTRSRRFWLRLWYLRCNAGRWIHSTWADGCCTAISLLCYRFIEFHRDSQYWSQLAPSGSILALAILAPSCQSLNLCNLLTQAPADVDKRALMVTIRTRLPTMPEPWDKFNNAGVKAVRFSSWKSAPMTLMKFRMAITSSNLELPSDVRNAYWPTSPILPFPSLPILSWQKKTTRQMVKKYLISLRAS